MNATSEKARLGRRIYHGILVLFLCCCFCCFFFVALFMIFAICILMLALFLLLLSPLSLWIFIAQTYLISYFLRLVSNYSYVGWFTSIDYVINPAQFFLSFVLCARAHLTNNLIGRHMSAEQWKYNRVHTGLMRTNRQQQQQKIPSTTTIADSRSYRVHINRRKKCPNNVHFCCNIIFFFLVSTSK